MSELPPLWLPGPSEPRLSAGEVHLWFTSLELPPEVQSALELLLSPEERRRRDRYRFPADRRRFGAARGGLRALLARYAGVRPRELRFADGERGKPYLLHPGMSPGIAFNLSHSGERAVVAVTLGRQLGVDIEAVRPLARLATLADHFFPPVEVRLLRSLPPPRREQLFFTLWARKEAVVKAAGMDLAATLQAIAVPRVLSRRGRSMHFPLSGTRRGRHWFLADFLPEPGFRGALCVVGGRCRIHRWLFDAADGGDSS